MCCDLVSPGRATLMLFGLLLVVAGIVVSTIGGVIIGRFLREMGR